MMRSILLTISIALLLTLVTNKCNAQTIVASSCEADSLLMEILQKDATRLAIRRLYETRNADTCLVEVPQIYRDSVLRVLTAVYNASSLEARKDVVELYDIHALGNPALNSVLLYLDTSFSWTESLMQNESSGYEEADNLMDKYALQLEDSKLSGVGTLLVRLSSPYNLNMAALGQIFISLDGVLAWQTDEIVGEASKDIIYQPSGNITKLVYRYSWGNCIQDCENDHYWYFEVNDACDVTFAGQDGSSLAIDMIEQLIEIRLFPNPSSDEVFVNLVGPPQKGLMMQLYNALGQLLEAKEVISNNGVIETQLSLANYPIGVYFIAFRNGQSILTEKIMKR